jgi:RND family efflux transporter MFP subunit
MMQKRTGTRTGSLAPACLLLFSFLGCGLFPKEDEPVVPALVEPVEQEYELFEVVRRDISRAVRGMGIVEPSEKHTLHFRRPHSRLRRIAVRLGQEVEEGSPLIFLDTEELEDQIALQELRLRKARLQLERSAALGADRFSQDMAKIDVLMEEHALATLERQYQRSVLTSPADGVVIFIDRLQEGDAVEAYRPLITVADPEKLHITYQSAKTSEVRLGMPVVVRHGEQTHRGRVVFAAGDAPPSADPRLRDAIIVSVPDLEQHADIGDFVDVEVLIESAESTLVVPKSALRRYRDRVYVHVLEGDRKRERDVEIGIESYTEVEILSGLEEGQKVILR